MTAYDTSGNESGYSNEVSKTVADTTPPGDVQNFTAVGGDQRITLSWTNPPDSDFVGVRIHYRTDHFPADINDGTLLGDFTGQPNQTASTAHTGLQNGVTYYYSASSYDASGNYQSTAQASATPSTSADNPNSTSSGGCGMIFRKDGEHLGPGQAADMMVLLAVPLIALMRRKIQSLKLRWALVSGKQRWYYKVLCMRRFLNVVKMEASNMKDKIVTKIILKPIMIGAFLVLLSPFVALAAPLILYTDILSGPNTGGEKNNGTYLSIFGKGFGTTKGLSDKVTINGVEVAAYKQWGANSAVYNSHGIQVITVQPGPAVSSGPVVVTAGGTASNAYYMFTVAPGKIFFVSLTGDDATGAIGDITKPFRLVDKTFQRSDYGAGDIIVIRGGTWSDVNGSGQWVNIKKGGTAVNPVVIMGYPGETVTYDAVAAGDKYRVFSAGGTYTYSGLVFSNLKLINLGGKENPVQFGIGVNSYHNDVRFVNAELSGRPAPACDSQVVGVAASNNIKILGDNFHDFAVGCPPGTPFQFQGYVIIYFAGRTIGGEVGWSRLYNIPTEYFGKGIQIRANDYTTEPPEGYHQNISVHDTVFDTISKDAIGWGDSAGVGMKFYNNIVTNTGIFEPKDLSGLRLNNGSGIADLHIEIYNNTFYGQDPTKWSIAFDSQLGATGSAVIKDNIFQAAAQTEQYYTAISGFDFSKVTASNNIWYGSNQAVPMWDTNPINKDPLLINPTAPTRNFRLQSGSPAIDAGVKSPVTRDIDGQIRPQGATFDIGAYEYCASTCSAGDTLPPAKPTGLTVK